MPRSVKCLAACVVAAGLVMFSMTSVAFASPGQGGGTGSGNSDHGVITGTVEYTTDGSAGDGSGSRCIWTVVDIAVTVPGVGTVTWPHVRDGRTYHLWRRTCGGVERYFEIPETTPRDVLPGLLRDVKQNRLPHPVPVFELLDPEFGWAYVQTPLDFRAGSDSWRTVVAEASIGPVWARVTAVPEELIFDPGDPAGDGPVSCVGAGPTADYVPELPGACAYTYRNASSTSTYDGYHFKTSLTIRWSVSWVGSDGSGGPLAGFSTSSSAELAVAEVQGLVVCTGPRPEQGGC
jgi:hypothetical protein